MRAPLSFRVEMAFVSTQPSIRYIIGSLGRGGAEHHLSQLLPMLKKRGWHVWVVTLSHELDLKSVFDQAQIQVAPPVYSDLYQHLSPYLPNALCRGWRICTHIRHLVHDLKRYPEALTHCFLPESYVMGMVARGLYTFIYGWRKNTKALGPVFMARRSTNDYQNRRPLLGRIERLCHRFVHHITVNSQRNLDQLCQMEQVPLSKATLIYNGVLIPDPSHDPPRDPHGFHMVMVANLHAYKGHLDVIEALHILQDDLTQLYGDHWSIRFIGKDRGVLKQAQERVAAYRLSDHVFFLGDQADVTPHIMGRHVGLLASHEEGFSNALLEKMAAGLPCVVTDVGGNSEAIIDGQHGFVVPAHAPSSLAEKILILATDHDRRERMGEAARKRAHEIFSLDEMTDRYEKLYS